MKPHPSPLHRATRPRTAALTRSQILQQAGTAVLAQANAIPNNVLSLLR